MGFDPDRKIKPNATEQAVIDIMKILRGLPSPRYAAATVALVRANLFLAGGANTAADVSAMMNDDDKAAMTMWTTINRIAS